MAIRLTFYLGNGDFLLYAILSWHFPSTHYSDSSTNFSNNISISAPHNIEEMRKREYQDKNEEKYFHKLRNVLILHSLLYTSHAADDMPVCRSRSSQYQ